MAFMGRTMAAPDSVRQAFDGQWRSVAPGVVHWMGASSVFPAWPWASAPAPAPASPTSGSGSIVASDIAKDLQAGNSLTYSSVLSILEDAATGGMNASKYNS